jgi:hypothetical protein
MIFNLIWILVASTIGFGISAIFSGWLKMPRNLYLFVYIPAIASIFILFILYNDISLNELLIKNWYWGILGAAIASFIVIRNVLSQPSSKRNSGGALLRDILWPGFAYGLIDSLLLSVLPVLSIIILLSEFDWTKGLIGKIVMGIIALLASSFVTISYHLGYHEFRNKRIVWTVFGNGVLSLAYILTMNPLAAILPHIGMHITAMIHGRETTGQVPPHYEDS